MHNLIIRKTTPMLMIKYIINYCSLGADYCTLLSAPRTGSRKRSHSNINTALFCSGRDLTTASSSISRCANSIFLHSMPPYSYQFKCRAYTYRQQKMSAIYNSILHTCLTSIIHKVVFKLLGILHLAYYLEKTTVALCIITSMAK